MLQFLPQGSAPFDFLGLGEVLQCLSIEVGEQMNRADRFVAKVGGSEANVAAALRAYGLRTAILTGLPRNDRGFFVNDALRGAGVSDDFVKYLPPESRVGLYYYAPGSGTSNFSHSKVLYDRANSAFTQLTTDMLGGDFRTTARVFHTSGITLALSAGKALATHIAQNILEREPGVKVSYDINYRSALWSEDEARKTNLWFLRYVDYLNVSYETCRRMFALPYESEKDCARHFAEEYGIGVVSLTKRDGGTWQAMMYDAEDKSFVQSRKYENLPTLGRVGSGDTAVAGSLGAMLAGMNLQEAVDLMSAFMVRKLSVSSDMLVRPDLKEIQAIITQQGSGDVKR